MLRDWRMGPPVFPGQQSNLLEPRRILCLGMRGDGYQLSGASGMPPLSDATAPKIDWNPISANQLGTSTLSSLETHQFQYSSGRRRSLLRRRWLWGPAPLQLDPSSERPVICAWRGRSGALWKAPGLRPCPPSGVGPLSRWRETSLAPRYFLPPLGATSRRSWLQKMAAFTQWNRARRCQRRWCQKPLALLSKQIWD